MPEVNYLLWTETLKLLKQEHKPNSIGRVLVNANGAPLCTERVGDDGKFKRTDNIKNAFDRLKKKIDLSKPLKSLKKTSASLLRGNEKYQGLEGLFLGHAPKSMSDKHYTAVPEKLFDEAISWLATELNIAAHSKEG